MAIPVNDPETLSDDSLLASLLGLAVRCPYGTAVTGCPFLPMQRQPLKHAFASLSALSREERIALLRAHRACLQELESR